MIASGLAQMTCNLYSRMWDGAGSNVFFSPWSIRIALAMAAVGAKGKTRSELLGSIGFDPDMNDPSLLLAISESMKSADGGPSVTLRASNAFWPQEGDAFNEDYINVLKTAFGSTFKALDYRGAAAKAAADTINAQIEDDTNQLIKNLITMEAVKDAKAVITNAIYFKGDWGVPFNKDLTKDADFRGLSKTVKVPLMFANREMRYYEDDKVQAVSLPYQGQFLSSLYVLPKEVGGLTNLKLSDQYLGEMLANASSRTVRLHLPRYELQADYKLVKMFKDMGATVPFSDDADFSGVCDTSKEAITISEIVHKAYEKTDEKGTEAAAATGVVFARCTAFAPVKIVEMRMDHPFFRAILNEATGETLFAGAFNQPE